MKSFYLLLPTILLFLIGCSSTYRVTNYHSKEAFHEDVNSSMSSRDVNVVTVDSSFTALEGSRIKDDSLQIVFRTKEKIPLSKIRDIKYYGNAYEAPSASVWLKSGEELTTEKVKILPDSSVQFINITNETIPLTDIKNVNYTNHWVGLGVGMFAGAMTGFALARLNLEIKYSGGGIEFNNYFWGFMVETVVGTILGTIIGWNIIYQFIP